MTEFFRYLIISSVYLLVFYLSYFIFMSRDTHYLRNRIYLLISILISLTLPLFRVNVDPESVFSGLNRELASIIHLGSVNVMSYDTSSKILTRDPVLLLVYLTGALTASVLLLNNIIQIILQIRKGRKQSGNIILIESDSISGFTAFGYIFVKEGLCDEESNRIIEHERNHLTQKHFSDLMLIKVSGVLLWFNPVIFLYERSLKAVHEYQADNAMIGSGCDVLSYQKLLLNQIFKTSLFNIHNAFAGKSLIKKRMIMMTRKKSGKISIFKMFISMPLLVVAFILFSCNEESSVTAVEPEPIDEVVVVAKAGDEIKPAREAGELKEVFEDENTFSVVEDMPTFQGGDLTEFRKWVMKNVKYPDIAKEKGIQGNVFIHFIVNEEGMVSIAEVAKSVDPSLDNEALRVVKSSPKWIPGRNDGKAVKVKFSLAINFVLQ